MTEIGTVIDGKYEILKQIGKGGMSIVYLAMDKRLNKQWAIKEIRKNSNGENDEIIVNSLLAEANMMKKLDHPSLPRIVDIIDNGITIYVIMDYIEGESLDKILNQYGLQDEDTVISWAKQICDALSYLHSQKPSIIYRDMKPANVMLKPEGTIKIIDFGIAREYKEQNLSDTTVLGTKGYAPPEQYSGQTDARSDIFALGMTMHNLLTGIDPRNGESYAPVRMWNPNLSEGIEIIIDKCVQPAPENRYQTCQELLYDLEHPDLITKGYKKKQKIKLATFLIAISLSILLGISSIVLNLVSTNINNKDYNTYIQSTNVENYYKAIELYPERYQAYEKLIEYYKSQKSTNEEITKVGNTIEMNSDKLNTDEANVANMYYDMGKLYFSEYDDTFKGRAIMAQNFFNISIESISYFDKKEIASCYNSICKFMTNQSTTQEHSLDDYNALINEIQKALSTVENSTDNESNYDKISLYYVVSLLLNDQAEFMAGVGIEREIVIQMMDKIYKNSNAITSTLIYVNDLKSEINLSYQSFLDNINAKYNEVEKRQ